MQQKITMYEYKSYATTTAFVLGVFWHLFLVTNVPVPFNSLHLNTFLPCYHHRSLVLVTSSRWH